MKKIILFSSIACALTACGGDGADPAPRTEPPAVSGKLTYTDESGKLVGELRGEDLAEFQLVANGNNIISQMDIWTKAGLNSPSKPPTVGVLWSGQDEKLAFEERSPFVIRHQINENLVGGCIQGGIFTQTLGQPQDCIQNTTMLKLDSQSGSVIFTQKNTRLLEQKTSIPVAATKDGITIDINKPKYFYVSGSLSSTIPPTSLIFQKNRFPVRSINSSLNDSLMGAIQPKEIYAYYEDVGTIALPTSQRRLRLAVGNTELVLDAENQKIISYVNTAKIPTLIQLPDGTTMPVDPVTSLSEWNCVENCAYELATIGNQRRITLNNAVLQHKQNYLQRLTLTGAVEFAPHQAKLSLKQESINTEYSFVSSIVRNNTAIYTSVLPVPRTASTCSNGKQIAIKRENQTIKSVEVTCDHWDSVTKTNVQTVFGVCGLPNTPTCTGASLSADGHTFSFVKTKLSNNEELNGTLYFAGVAAADPAVTTP